LAWPQSRKNILAAIARVHLLASTIQRRLSILPPVSANPRRSAFKIFDKYSTPTFGHLSCFH
jgi:hypothetical protein